MNRIAGPARILIVDDNAAIHEDYRKILIAKEGDVEFDRMLTDMFGDSGKSASSHAATYQLDSAFQGEEAYRMVQAAMAEGRPYAMAFVDMRMPPGWDGLQTIEHLWKVDPNLNVVICTAYSDHSWTDMSARLGADDRWILLRKPFDSAEVAQLAASLVEKSRVATELRKLMRNLENEVVQSNASRDEAQDRLLAVLATAPDGIINCRLDGSVESVNQAALRLLGVESQAIIGKPIQDLIGGKEPREQVSAFIAATTADAPLAFDATCECPSGNHFPASWTIARFSQHGHSGLTAIVRDETERERLRCELTQSQKLEAVGQLAAGIAHEINTPTQFVAGNVEFLCESFADLNAVQEDILGFLNDCQGIGQLAGRVETLRGQLDEVDFEYLQSEIPKTLNQTLRGLERITKIVQAMKDFSHPGNGEKMAANIHAAIESTATVAQNEWKYVAEMEFDFDQRLTGVPCLISELNQVFINLIVNAAHAIAEKQSDSPDSLGTIRIRTQKLEDAALIEISDTGCGIPESIKSRIYDPFFTTKGVGKGTGQGLAIARSVIVDKHQGTIDCESVPGEGTTFRIKLPLDPAYEAVFTEAADCTC